MIRYYPAPDIQERVKELVGSLGFDHIDVDRVICLRSRGSKASRALARIHGLPRVWQRALASDPLYVIEVISERFDALGPDERDKVLIHELLHIPKGFGGGLRGHKKAINRKRVDRLYSMLVSRAGASSR
ncbi:MAG: putative metallopeptidase [Candidatus Bathyarchaeia archaeon]